MSAPSTHTSAPLRTPIATTVRNVWRQPLYRSGHALVFNSVLTSGVGVLFWVAAARLYPTATVGRNSAAISAMMFLAVAAQLNLKSALVRFVPVAGARAQRLIVGAYLLGGSLAGVATLVFLGGLRMWAPDLSFLTATPAIAVWFAASSAVWAVFVMQESALTGLGRAVAVPVQNIVFSIAKFTLVVVFAGLLPVYGILASWTLSMAVVAVGTNAYLLARAVPAFTAAAPVLSGEPLSVRRLAHFMSGDYVGSLLNYAAVWLLPFVVLALTGPRDAAVFTLAWNVAYTLYLVPSAMGQSLVAHTAADQQNLSRNRRGVLLHSYRLLLPAAAVLIVAAPWVLRVFGAEYSEKGGGLLRLLALSAIPGVITALAVSEARVRRRMRVVVAVYGSLSALVLGLSVALLPVFGIVGVGVAWLTGQTLVAAVLLGSRGESGWRDSVFDAGRALAPVASHIRRFPRACRYGLLARRALRRLAADRAGGVDLARDRVLRVVPSFSDTPVALVGTPGGDASGVLKIAASGSGAKALERQRAVLSALHADGRLDDWRALLPRVVAYAAPRGRPCVIERKLLEADGRQFLGDPDSRDRLLAAATEAIAQLHRRTASAARVGEEELGRWVDEPAGSLRLALRGRRSVGLRGAADRLAAALREELAGRQVAVAWVHGDYCPGNILAAGNGSTVTGIVDWGQAESAGLPALDVVTLLLTTETHVHRHELGASVRARLSGRPWTPRESLLLEAAARGLPGGQLDGRTLLLLGWLHHVGGNLAKSGAYAANPMWMHTNVHSVLRTAADE